MRFHIVAHDLTVLENIEFEWLELMGYIVHSAVRHSALNLLNVE